MCRRRSCSTAAMARGEPRRPSARRSAPRPAPAPSATRAPEGLAVGPDGSPYIATTLGGRVRRVAPDGIITTVAGNSAGCGLVTDPCGDGGPATQAGLGSPVSVAVGPDNSLYIG